VEIGEITLYYGQMSSTVQLPDSVHSMLQADSHVIPVDIRSLRKAMGQFATGVTVITTRTSDGTMVGLTVNSFGALSLEPALIVWSLRLSSTSLDLFQRAPRFVVNVLTDTQAEISRHFASGASQKFESVAYAENQHGLALLNDCSAWFECRRVSHQLAGDHCLFIAEVERFSSSDMAPLLFHAGGYFTLGRRL
jgi:flavin reductase (DIM6/NTAB) family NADH-FMN oxidoreductase RutF